MRMYVLDYGEITLLHDNRVTSGKNKATSIPIHGFLFDTPLGYILFDTGCDPHGMDGNWPKPLRANPYIASSENTVLGQLGKIGLTPSDIDIVVASHLHLDHAGMLQAFPQARVFVDRLEFQRTLHHYAEGNLDEFHLKSDIDHWLRAELNWHFICQCPEPIPLCEGLSLLALGPGHSYGMLGLLVHLDNSESYLLAGDAIYSYEHLKDAESVSSICYDPSGYLHTKRFLRSLSEKHHATILFGHDCKQYSSLIKISDGYY